MRFFIRAEKFPQTLLTCGALAAGVAGFSTLCRLVGAPLSNDYAIFGGAVAALAIFAFLIFNSKARECLPQGAWGIAALMAVGTILALSTARQLAAYLNLPVDLLSFSESPFVNDILKFRLGTPIYTPPGDNNSYPYTPGAPILTYLISAAFGHGASIPFYRATQFSYVLLACVMATSVCDLLARALLSEEERKSRFLWAPVWFLFLFLLATDRRFNLYTHSLHNDGLALLVSVSAYWLIVKHSLARRQWLVILMAVLPALGFLVKQNQLMWAAIFFVYLLAAGGVPARQLLLYLLCLAVSVTIVVGTLYLLWGDNFIWWIFVGLGSKQVSLFRVAQHLFDAGVYAIMGLFAGWILVLRDGSRTSSRVSSRTCGALWAAWLLAFGVQTYTTGIAWVTNHMGPGVMLSGCWLFVALLKVWPASKADTSWRRPLQEASAVCMVVLLFGALGFVREPRNPVPADFYRYVADIEREFQGTAPEKVLLDNGTWVYLKEMVLMKDRSAPVALHVGKNQPEINRAALAETIKRIERKSYDKILARQIFTDQSAYDFQDRGSGVKAAILANYVEERRIPAVQGVQEWWPMSMIAEISVMTPKRNREASISKEPAWQPDRVDHRYGH